MTLSTMANLWFTSCGWQTSMADSMMETTQLQTCGSQVVDDKWHNGKPVVHKM
jgi:hypothetical protein